MFLMKINSRLFFLSLLIATELQVCVQAQTGSLWASNGAGPANSYFSDRVSNQVGDLITILVDISTATSKNQQSTSNKSVSVNDSVTSLVFPQSGGIYDSYRYRGLNPATQFAANHAFTGGGQIANTEAMTTTIQARIVDALPNGTFRLEARRRFEASEEKSDLVLTGLVRREDISPANSVSSSLISELQIKQSGTGPLSREQRKGWLTKLYEFICPF